MRLSIRQMYCILKTDDPDRGPWKATTRAYAYIFEDADEREIVAFHWHPRGRGKMDRPHMHLGEGSGAEPRIRSVHFPTGRISVEDFLWLLIDGFDVSPRRDDWAYVLTAGRDAFEEWRTWA